MFIVNNIIYRQKTALYYSLAIKSGFLNNIQNLIIELIYTQLVIIAIEIKEINRCTNLVILALKIHIETVAAYSSHSYTRYFQF